MEVDITAGSITVRLGGVESYCVSAGKAMVHPDSPSGVQIISYTFSRAGTSWQVMNPVPVNDDVAITSTVPAGSWLAELDSLVVGFTWSTRPVPTPFSANDEAMAIVVVPYGGLSNALASTTLSPPAIGNPSNPAIAAIRATPLVFDNDTIDALPGVIDIDALPTTWGTWDNARPDIDDYLARFAGFCGELWKGWGVASWLPSQQHPGYGRTTGSLVSEALLMVVSTESASSRRELARRMAQWGVDLYGAFSSGRDDKVDGGHYQGRKALIVLAGHLLESVIVNAAAVFPGQFNEDEQFYTGSPAWVWGWPYGYRGNSDYAVNLDAPIASWNSNVVFYLTGYFEHVCGVQLGTAVAMNILGRRAEMGIAHYGMMEQWMEGPAPADAAAMELRAAALANIPWGESYSAYGTTDFARAAWEAYGDYTPPATTVVTYDHSAHASPRYTATVQGDPLSIWGRTTTTQFATPFWAQGANIDQSGATFTADGPVEIVVSLVSGSITSAVVYTNDPTGPVIPSAVIAGQLEFTLPENTTAWCEINALRGQPLLLRNLPPITQPTGPTVDIYDGSQTTAVAGRTLVFPPGTHTIGQSFPVPAGAKVWLHGEAWVIGSLHYLTTAGGHEADGDGILSGEWGASLRATIRALPTHDEMVTYSLIYGTFGLTNPSKVRRITLLDPPFYTTHFGVSEVEDVLIVGPWWGNSDAFNIAQQGEAKVGHVKRSCAFIHDNVIFLEEYLGAHVYDNNIVGSVVSSAVHVSFWPLPEAIPDQHSGTNNTIVCLYSTNGIVKSWCDGSDTSHVVKGVAMTGLRFVGSSIPGRPFWIENRLYPIEWGPQALGLGQITEFTFSNVTFEVVPAQKSIIKGWDANNAPSKIAFNDVSYAGTRMTAANFLDYFEIDGFVRDITVDGVRVDLVRTTGAASVAVGASGTSGLLVASIGGVTVPISAAGAAALLVGAVGSAAIPIAASGFSTLGVVPPPVVDVPMNVPRGPGVRPWTRRRRAWWTWLNPW